MTLGDLARAAGIGRSTAHRYLQSLLKEGMVQQDTASGHYDLGPMALSIGTAALKRVDAVEIASRHMRQLAQDHAVSGGVAVWTDRGPTLVRWFRSAYLAINPVGLGDVLPIDNTACGLVFQAYLPASRIETARRNQAPFFQGQPPSPDQLQQTRLCGWAQRSNHLLPNITGQAAIILDAQQEVACAVTSFADVGSLRSVEDNHALLRAARQINLETGGMPAQNQGGRPFGTIIGLPVTGSEMISDFRPNTCSIRASVTISSGLPSAMIAPSRMAIRCEA